MDGTGHISYYDGLALMLASLGNGAGDDHFVLHLRLLLKALDYEARLSVNDLRGQMALARNYLDRFIELHSVLDALRSPVRDNSPDVECPERVNRGHLLRGFFRNRNISETRRQSAVRMISERHARARFSTFDGATQDDILPLPAEKKKLLALLANLLIRTDVFARFRDWESTRSKGTLPLPLPIEQDMKDIFEGVLKLRDFLKHEGAEIEAPCAPSDAQESLFEFKQRVAKDELRKKGVLK